MEAKHWRVWDTKPVRCWCQNTWIYLVADWPACPSSEVWNRWNWRSAEFLSLSLSAWAKPRCSLANWAPPPLSLSEGCCESTQLQPKWFVISAAFSTELPWSCYDGPSNQYLTPAPSYPQHPGTKGSLRELNLQASQSLIEATLPHLFWDSCPDINVTSCDAALPGSSTSRE